LKRTAPFLATAAALALLAPAASAERVELRGGSAPKPKVEFTAVIRDGEPVKVKGFEFKNIILRCTEGNLIVSNKGNPLPGIGVKNNRFGATFKPDGQKVKVNGKFSTDAKTARGKLRIQGDYVDNTGAPFTSCDSGKVKFKAG
jgi:hypothetical protein